MTDIPINRIYMTKESLARLHYDLGELEKFIKIRNNLMAHEDFDSDDIRDIRKVEEIIERLV